MTGVVSDLPQVAFVEPRSAAARAGLRSGDSVAEVNGVVPRDVIEWHHLVEHDDLRLVVHRGGERLDLQVRRQPGEPFGAEVSSAVFDRVHTCDNHCEFCFIYQLPKGMRRSLYLKDDDYRLSFLYGNFTTLTRFTEADFERVVTQRLSPIYVSIHATDPTTRATMLRNQRGGISLRWAQGLVRHGIEIRGQIVLCPGVNDAHVLERTMLDLLDHFDGLSAVAVVPLGLSRHNTETRMRVHSLTEARQVVQCVERWQKYFTQTLGRRFVHLADEFYLQAGIPLPSSEAYEGFEMLEDGIGIARRFVDSFREGKTAGSSSQRHSFFASVSTREGSLPSNPSAYASNPARDTGLRRAEESPVTIRKVRRNASRVTILTGECAAPVLAVLISEFGDSRVEVRPVPNTHFGGNTSVAGLLTGTDISAAIDADTSLDTMYLLPDVCLNSGRFLDGITLDEIQSRGNVLVVPSDGATLRRVLEDVLSTNAEGGSRPVASSTHLEGIVQP